MTVCSRASIQTIKCCPFHPPLSIGLRRISQGNGPGRGFRVIELIAVAGADHAHARAPMAEKVFAALPDAHEAIDPSEDSGVLKGLDALGHGRAGAIGLLGDLLIGREAKAA